MSKKPKPERHDKDECAHGHSHSHGGHGHSHSHFSAPENYRAGNQISLLISKYYYRGWRVVAVSCCKNNCPFVYDHSHNFGDFKTRFIIFTFFIFDAINVCHMSSSLSFSLQCYPSPHEWYW